MSSTAEERSLVVEDKITTQNYDSKNTSLVKNTIFYEKK